MIGMAKRRWNKAAGIILRARSIADEPNNARETDRIYVETLDVSFAYRSLFLSLLFDKPGR